MRKVNGYLHVAAMGTPECLAVLSEMNGRLLESGVYSCSDSISVGIVGCPTQAEEMYSTVFKQYPKYHVRFFSPNLLEWEYPTLGLMQEDSRKANGLVWYAHTKGVSSYNPKVPDRIQRNSTLWRNVLCHDVFTNYKRAIQAILHEGYVAAGPLYISGPERYPEGSNIPRHFSGNFWWSSHKYIRSLPPFPIQEHGRLGAEFWVGMGIGKLYPLSVCQTSVDLYGTNWGGPGESPLSQKHLWCKTEDSTSLYGVA